MIKSTAAIAGGRVYAASLNGEVFCRDLRTGEKLWTYQSQIPAKPDAFIPGFKAGVAVTADTVYIGDEDGVFHAIDRAAPAQGKWKFEAAGEITPALRTLSTTKCSSLRMTAACILPERRRWIQSLAKFATQGQIYGSPPIAGDFTFVAGCDEHLRVINVKTGQQATDMPFGIQLISSPAVVDNMLYVGTYGNEILAIDWKNSVKVWAYDGGKARYDSSAAVTDKYVIAGSQDKKLHCIERKSGKQVWAFATKAHVDSSPVVVGDYVFVGSNDGTVDGIGLDSGQEVWRYNDGRPFSASPAVGEGCLVIGSESSTGQIVLFWIKIKPGEPGTSVSWVPSPAHKPSLPQLCHSETLPTAETTEVGSYFVANYPPFSQWKPDHLPEFLAAARRAGPGIRHTRWASTFTFHFAGNAANSATSASIPIRTPKRSNGMCRLWPAKVELLSAIVPQSARRYNPRVYFGGGTRENRIAPRQLQSLRDRLHASVSWDDAEEVTFECEPGTLSLEKVQTLKAIGITRVSLGVEKFNDQILEANGRAHCRLRSCVPTTGSARSDSRRSTST